MMGLTESNQSKNGFWGPSKSKSTQHFTNGKVHNGSIGQSLTLPSSQITSNCNSPISSQGNDLCCINARPPDRFKSRYKSLQKENGSTKSRKADKTHHHDDRNIDRKKVFSDPMQKYSELPLDSLLISQEHLPVCDIGRSDILKTKSTSITGHSSQISSQYFDNNEVEDIVPTKTYSENEKETQTMPEGTSYSVSFNKIPRNFGNTKNTSMNNYKKSNISIKEGTQDSSHSNATSGLISSSACSFESEPYICLHYENSLNRNMNNDKYLSSSQFSPNKTAQVTETLVYLSNDDDDSRFDHSVLNERKRSQIWINMGDKKRDKCVNVGSENSNEKVFKVSSHVWLETNAAQDEFEEDLTGVNQITERKNDINDSYVNFVLKEASKYGINELYEYSANSNSHSDGNSANVGIFKSCFLEDTSNQVVTSNKGKIDVHSNNIRSDKCVDILSNEIIDYTITNEWELGEDNRIIQTVKPRYPVIANNVLSEGLVYLNGESEVFSEVIGSKPSLKCYDSLSYPSQNSKLVSNSNSNTSERNFLFSCNTADCCDSKCSTAINDKVFLLESLKKSSALSEHPQSTIPYKSLKVNTYRTLHNVNDNKIYDFDIGTFPILRLPKLKSQPKLVDILLKSAEINDRSSTRNCCADIEFQSSLHETISNNKVLLLNKSYKNKEIKCCAKNFCHVHCQVPFVKENKSYSENSFKSLNFKCNTECEKEKILNEKISVEEASSLNPNIIGNVMHFGSEKTKDELLCGFGKRCSDIRNHTWPITKYFYKNEIKGYFQLNSDATDFNKHIDCSFTCHEQCQKVVSLDCKVASSDAELLLEDELIELLTEEDVPSQQEVDDNNGISDKEQGGEDNKKDNNEGGEEEILEKEMVENHILSNFKKSEVSTLKRTTHRIQSNAVDSVTIEEWVQKCPSNNVGLQITKESDGGYRGCLRVHLNLCRPINIVAGTRPPSIYDILQEDRTMEKTLTSFYMPRDAVKAIHITNKTTTREVIAALLKKFKVVDNPQKFALYERSFDAGHSMKAKLRRLSDHDCPLVLAIAWNAQGVMNKRLVLQENDTADIQWEAFTLPELGNFLRILDREELEYKNQIRDKYKLLKLRMETQLANITNQIQI